MAVSSPVGAPAHAAPATAPDGSARRRRWAAAWPWLVGVVAGMVVLGPALAPGSMFSLDLVLTPQIPVPRGVWGLGPELPRRIPLMLPAAWLSPVIPGWVTGKVMIVGSVALAFVGVHRLVRPRSELAALGAGLLYALNPFMLTRIAAGHIAIFLAMAILPWCLSVLLRPDRRLAATFLCCAALGFTGSYGGIFAGMLVVAGLLNRRGARTFAVLGLWLVAQLPWLIPGLLVLDQGGAVTEAGAFTTIGRGVAGKAQILAGHGFWNFTFQSGFTGIDLADQLPVAVVAITLLVLAVIGARDLPRDWRWPAAALAGIGAFIAIISSFEYDANPYFALTRNVLGANFRESLRALPLYLVWMAPAAAFGALRVATWVGGLLDRDRTGRSALAESATMLVRALPLGLALYLAVPGLWGVEGHLRSADLPAGWEEVRSRVLAEPGTVVALPWHAYMPFDLGGRHLVLNPWPYYLGGDVIICSDPERRSRCDSDDAGSERADRREVVVSGLVRSVRDGQPISGGLARLGVRWVVMSHVADWQQLQALDRDPGLERVVSTDTVDLYRVRDWAGLVVDADGRGAPASSALEPVVQTDLVGPGVLARPASSGWLRGLTTTGATSGGLVELPSASGPVWYWPVLLVLAGDAVFVVFTVWALRLEWRHRRPGAASAGPVAEGASERPFGTAPETVPEPPGADSEPGPPTGETAGQGP